MRTVRTAQGQALAPEGLLLAQQWLAPSWLYELDYEGLPDDDTLCLNYGRIQYRILVRLHGLKVRLARKETGTSPNS